MIDPEQRCLLAHALPDRLVVFPTSKGFTLRRETSAQVGSLQQDDQSGLRAPFNIQAEDEAEDEAENEAIKKVAEDPTVLPAELEAYGPQAELGVAFPVMIQNLSNFSRLRSAPSTDNENITHHFGHLKDDEAMLHDKLSGFITVLHAAMDGQEMVQHILS